MNLNYLTSTKESDYRFVSRLLLCVFKQEELLNGCVKMNSQTNPTRYNLLDQTKFDFIKGTFEKYQTKSTDFILILLFSFSALFAERVKGDKGRLNDIFKHVNAKCSSIRSNFKT